MNKKQSGSENSRSSLFDYGLYAFTFLCPIFFLSNWDLNMIQNIFFVFGVFALLGLSFLCPRRMKYKNKFIGIIILLPLINIFIHTFNTSLSKGITSSFINYCLMSEGFIYILCGSLLFWLIVSYSRNFNIAYPVLLINIINLGFVILQRIGIKFIWTRIDGICGILGFAPHMVIFSALSIPILYHFYRPLTLIPLLNMLIGHYGWGHSFTGIFALMAAVGFYLKRMKKEFCVWVILSVCFILMNWNFFFSKMLLRFKLWNFSFKEIIHSPIIGNGFDNSLSMNMINIGRGFMYRHNDYLNIGRDLGLFFLTVLLIAIWKVLYKSRIDWMMIAILIIGISCLTWTSFYFARLASIGIILLALKERQNYGRMG